MLKEINHSVTNRFSFVASKQIAKEKQKTNGVFLVNTEYNTQWAERNFLSWIKNHNEKMLDNLIPVDLLHSHDPDCFVMET